MTSDENGPAIIHGAALRFTARWTTGTAAPATIEGSCWTDDEGAGDEDSIHIHSMAWTDEPPDQARFEAPMRSAAAAIVAAIAGQQTHKLMMANKAKFMGRRPPQHPAWRSWQFGLD